MKVSNIYNKVLFFSLLLLTGCTKVDLCDEQTHPHQGIFSVKYDWGIHKSEVKNESEVYFIATRILNTTHYVDSTDIDGEFIRENSGKTTSQNVSKLSFATGEYLMMAFTKPTMGKDAKVGLAKLYEYRGNNSVETNKIMMRHIATTSSKELDGKEWTDFNPDYGYVREPATEKLFVARPGTLEISVGKDYTQPFIFQPLFQHIDIDFSIDFVKGKASNGNVLEVDENDIIMGDIIAEISGIVPEVSLSTGFLNVSQTKKMLVKVVKMGTKGNTAEKKTVSYRASFNTFGLIGGVNKETILGPGIFRLGIDLKDKDGKKKMLRIVANISEKIEQKGLTGNAEQPNQRIKVKDEAIITLDTHLLINSAIVSINNNDGISGWEVEQ